MLYFGESSNWFIQFSLTKIVTLDILFLLQVIFPFCDKSDPCIFSDLINCKELKLDSNVLIDLDNSMRLPQSLLIVLKYNHSLSD